MTSKKNGENIALPQELVSNTITPEVCPSCESELFGIRKMFNGGGKALQRLDFKCPDCKDLIYARKLSRYFAIGKQVDNPLPG